MIELIGKSLFQWDLGKQVKINESVDEVHLANQGDTEALVVEPKTVDDIVVADIPNILLQTASNITVYAVKNGKTISRRTFSVTKREKPLDYVYTETEVKNYEALEKKIAQQIAEMQQAIPTVPTNVSAFNNDANYAKKSDIPAKTSQLTNDSGYLTDTGVFIATYGTTTYEEVVQAYEAGKSIAVIITLESKTIIANLTFPKKSTSGYSFTFAGDENGISHYASIDFYNKTWNYWIYEYYQAIKTNTQLFNNLDAKFANAEAKITKITTNYKSETISAGGTFNLRQKGVYIFCGYDYCLDLYDKDGSLTGKENSIIIVLFCTEADANGNFSVYCMQNYKTVLGVSSINGMPYGNFSKNAYVKNNNTSNAATVFYMRQNEV